MSSRSCSVLSANCQLSAERFHHTRIEESVERSPNEQALIDTVKLIWKDHCHERPPVLRASGAVIQDRFYSNLISNC